MGRIGRDNCLQSFVFSDAMFDMNHMITDGKLAGIGDESLGAPPPLDRPVQPVAKNILLADQRDLWVTCGGRRTA